jgi:hypothetical protein
VCVMLLIKGDPESGAMPSQELPECAAKLKEIITDQADTRTMTFRKVQAVRRELGFGTETFSKAMDFLKGGEDVVVMTTSRS